MGTQWEHDYLCASIFTRLSWNALIKESSLHFSLLPLLHIWLAYLVFQMTTANTIMMWSLKIVDLYKSLNKSPFCPSITLPRFVCVGGGGISSPESRFPLFPHKGDGEPWEADIPARYPARTVRRNHRTLAESWQHFSVKHHCHSARHVSCPTWVDLDEFLVGESLLCTDVSWAYPGNPTPLLWGLAWEAISSQHRE